MATAAELTPLRVKNLTLVLHAIMAIKYRRYCKLKTDDWDRLGMSCFVSPNLSNCTWKNGVSPSPLRGYFYTYLQRKRVDMALFVQLTSLIFLRRKKNCTEQIFRFLTHNCCYPWTKKSVQVQAMICRWWQQWYIIIWTYSLCSRCIWICFVVKVNV